MIIKRKNIYIVVLVGLYVLLSAHIVSAKTTVVNYTAPGKYQFTLPANATDVTFEVWGAGGGSGGPNYCNSWGCIISSGGGGGGAYIKKYFNGLRASDLRAPVDIEVGAGGAGNHGFTNYSVNYPYQFNYFDNSKGANWVYYRARSGNTSSAILHFSGTSDYIMSAGGGLGGGYARYTNDTPSLLSSSYVSGDGGKIYLANWNWGPDQRYTPVVTRVGNPGEGIIYPYPNNIRTKISGGTGTKGSTGTSGGCSGMGCTYGSGGTGGSVPYSPGESGNSGQVRVTYTTPDIGSYIDIGLRVYESAISATVAIAIESPTIATSSVLRMYKDGVIYRIALVDTTDTNASKTLIRTASGNKALRRCDNPNSITHTCSN